MTSQSELQTIYQQYTAGNLEAAKSAIDAALQRNPAHPKTLHLAGIISGKSGDHRSGHNYLAQALRLTPDDPEILNALGSASSALNDPVRAEKAYLAALAINPSYQAALQNLAFHRLGQQNPEAALESFEGLLKLAPDNTVYQLGRATALRDCERAEAALEALDNVTSTGKMQEQDFLRSQILFALGRYDEVITNNETLLGYPRYAAGTVENTAQIYQVRGQWEKAEGFLEEIIRRNKSQPALIAIVAKSYMRAGKIDKAQSVLNTALATHPGDADLLSVRGQIKLDQDNYEAAYADSLAALTARPGDLGLMSEFALSALAAGRNDDAGTAVQGGLSLAPNDQFWQAMRAVTGRAMGQDHSFMYDYNEFVRAYELSAPNGYATMREFNEALKATLIRLHEFEDAPLDQSVRGGVQTSPNLRYVKDPVVQKFFTALDAPLRDYMAAIGTDRAHPLKRRNTGQYRIVTAWSILLQAGGHHVNHVHPEGWISSAYYVDVPKNTEQAPDKAGWIKFGEPPFKSDRLTAEHFIAPKAGQLVLFPSYMWHGTIPFTGAETRLTLPFDVVPA